MIRSERSAYLPLEENCEIDLINFLLKHNSWEGIRLKVINGSDPYIYIYIYIEREREREKELGSNVNSILVVNVMTTKIAPRGNIYSEYHALFRVNKGAQALFTLNNA